MKIGNDRNRPPGLTPDSEVVVSFIPGEDPYAIIEEIEEEPWQEFAADETFSTPARLIINSLKSDEPL